MAGKYLNVTSTSITGTVHGTASHVGLIGGVVLIVIRPRELIVFQLTYAQPTQTSRHNYLHNIDHTLR